jgi:hypothetical protein
MTPVIAGRCCGAGGNSLVSAVSIAPSEPDYSRRPWVDRMIELSFNWWLVDLQWLYEWDPSSAVDGGGRAYVDKYDFGRAIADFNKVIAISTPYDSANRGIAHHRKRVDRRPTGREVTQSVVEITKAWRRPAASRT